LRRNDVADTASDDRNGVGELKVQVAEGCRIPARLGLADYLGHVSARVPGTNYVLIKARGVDPGNLPSVMGAAGKPILPMQGVTAPPSAYPLPPCPSSLKVVTTEQGKGVADTMVNTI